MIVQLVEYKLVNAAVHRSEFQTVSSVGKQEQCMMTAAVSNPAGF